MVLMPDSIPPATPLDFEGIVDSTGIVTLTWKSNTEEDLAGYRIYRSNYKEDGYVKINNEQITTNRFADTISLRVLTKKIYYRLGAIDNHYNESVLTTALVIIRPDTIKPASPVFKDYVVNDSAIVISWINSPSQDINDHALYRRKIGENKWMRINMAGDTTGIYTDTDIVNQTIYQYIIIASDLGGLESEPINTLDIRYGGQAKSNNTNIELKAAADPSGKAILINWRTGPDIEKYALYRSVDDGPLVLYFTLNGAEKSFNDKNVRIGHSYRYRIQTVAKDGLRSPLSDEIKVQF
jgi:fibronectin type 3 domain-containing protein